ncbi:MAG: hypothetical protein AAGD25_16720 [Cyanobacteria bacterium P01_F01_bin.150]
MRVTLRQASQDNKLLGWIQILIEGDRLCTQIQTSFCFDPFVDLYVWLGQVQGQQLPAEFVTDEEGRGVRLIA